MTLSTHLTLTGEQNLVLTLPPKDPVLIKGAAGSGKTTVAVYRAKHLHESYRDFFRAGRIAVFSFTNSLVNFIKELLPSGSFSVMTLHKQAMQLVRRHPEMARLKPTSPVSACIDLALAAARQTCGRERSVLQKDRDFFQKEIAWIKGRCIATLDAYRNTPRTGRGTADRVTADDREVLWLVYTEYNRHLRTAGSMDWDDVILGGLHIASQPGFQPPFTHIVLDEAQDCTFAQLALIAKLVTPETNSITLVGDAAQRIYQSGFSWAETGIRVAGARSREFKKNYRNTKQIAAVATSLLSHEEDRTEFTESEVPEREGIKPILNHCASYAVQQNLLAQRLAAIPEGNSALVTAPTVKMTETISRELENQGFRVVNLKTGQRPCASNAAASSRTVFLSTMNSAKGLQADHVFLCSLNAGDLPPRGREEDPDEVSRSRKLLYVGLTRAQQTVELFFFGEPSRFLAEIAPEKIDKQRWKQST